MFQRSPSSKPSAAASSASSAPAPAFGGYSDMWSSALSPGTSSAGTAGVKKSYAESEAFKRRRGTLVASTNAASGPSTAQMESAPCRWVWTDSGFGQIVAESLADRAEQKAKEVALSFAPTEGSSSASAMIVAPAAQSSAASLLSSGASGASSSAAPQIAPPSSSSPSTSLNQFLSLIGTPKASAAAPAAAPAAPPAPSSSYYASYGAPPVPAPSSSAPSAAAAPVTLALSLPVVPPIVVNAPPSCTEDHVAVHLLPHYACPTLPRPNALSAASSSASGSSGTRGGPLSMPDALVSFSALPATVIYTPAARAFSSVRLRIRTFFDVASLIPKKKDSGSSSDDASGSSSKSFNQLLGAEIRARKEKAEKEKLMKDMTPSARDAFELQQKRSALSKAEREADEKTSASTDASSKSKPEGPPPQDLTIDVAAGESLRGVVQKIVEFYAAYGAELDADSVRLVSNGVEITRPHTVVPSCGVVAPAGGNAPVTPSAAAAAASGEPMVPFSAILEGLSPSSPLLERLTKLLNLSGGGGVAGSTIAQAQISLANAQALLAAAKENGGNLDSNTRKLLKAAMTQALPDFGKRGAAAAAAAAASKATPPSLAERERFYRAHTMLAEAGLVPLRATSVAVSPAIPNDGSSMSPASSASSAAAPNDAALPIFPLLLIYDELSRFSLDATTVPPEITLSPDGLGLTMSLSDNKWQTVRASAPFTSGKHLWKVRMDKCAGGNVFLGVCNATMKLNNYIGSDSNGWGYYGCGNIYRQGSSSSFGASYRTGDVICMKLDMDARTLSYDKNDSSLGVAFTDLPEAVYPAFSLYTKGDHIQISEFGTW